MSECNFHEDAVEFRVETASVVIGKCPLCGEDTEWSYRREPPPTLRQPNGTGGALDRLSSWPASIAAAYAEETP